MNTGLMISTKRNRTIAWLLLLLLLSFLAACGGDSGQVKPLGLYEAGSKTQTDLEDLLKADSRVQSFDINGDTVTVSVNESFTSAPYGLQQRALWSWYNTWQAAKSGKGAVIAQSNGTEVGRWNSTDGYKPVAQAKTEE